jgi:hypothetical protein
MRPLFSILVRVFAIRRSIYVRISFIFGAKSSGSRALKVFDPEIIREFGQHSVLDV